MVGEGEVRLVAQLGSHHVAEQVVVVHEPPLEAHLLAGAAVIAEVPLHAHGRERGS